MEELPKAYSPGEVEEKWRARWTDSGCFHANADSTKPAYSIVIPPPNVTGVLTLGHVLNNTMQDILARRARMKGHEVLWLPGTDHAGIATQSVVERRLRKEEKQTRHDLGREKFLAHVWAWKEKHGGIIIEQLKKLGCSCDWERERFTMDEGYSDWVMKCFVDLYHEGLIYRGRRMVNWCPASRTALSDEEVIMKPSKSTLYYMKYELAGEPGKFLEIATTRPETLMGDTGVAVHPEDARYKHLIGKMCRRPFPPAEIPIVGDEHIDPEFGTGVLKVTPAHDKADFEIGQRHGLEIVDVLHADGTLNEHAGPEFSGMERFAARKKATEKLAELGLLIREEPYENSVGFSERADVPIEPRISMQWFLRYPKTAEAVAAVEDGEIVFTPERWKKTYLHWMENIQDWCISRQLWWGHQIPAWYHKDKLEDLQDGTLEDEEARAHIHVGLEPPGDAENWVREEDVLDTWFSSWLWPFATMDAPTLEKFYPTDDLVTGPDIIFFWVARMIMAGYQFEDRKPFSHVFFTSIIRDQKGRKLSKSLGNSPDPLDLIANYGADGLRFGLLRIAPLGTDIRYDEHQIEEGRNFANKLWNAARFRQMQGNRESTGIPSLDGRLDALSVFDLDILAKLDALQANLETAYAGYRFNEAGCLLYEFFWSELCDRYLESIKTALASDDRRESTLAVLDATLCRFLMLLQPYMPHIAEELWEKLGFGQGEGEFLMMTKLPDEPVLANANPARVAEAREQAAAVHESVRRARNLKAEYNLAANRNVKFLVEPAADWVTAELETFSLLAGVAASDVLDPADAGSTDNAPAALTPLGKIHMPLEGLIDTDAEKQRIGKEISKVEKEIAKAKGKLSNPAFAEKAPEAIIQKERDRLADWEAQLAELRQMVEALG